MSDGKRRRSDSRSPPPQPRGGGRGAHDSLDDYGRGRSGRTDRDYDRDRERDRSPDRDRGGRGDREYDRSGGGGRRAVKDEPVYDAAGPRHGSERDRNRDRDRDDRDRERERGRREDRRERDDRGGGGDRDRGGLKRDAAEAGRDSGDWGGGRGGDRDREVKRERGANGDWSQPGVGGGGRRRGGGDDDEGGRGGKGGGGGEASRYMSAEEREERQRQAEEAAQPKAPKEQPNLGLSGKLAAETNKVAGGVELKHVPPPEARVPDKRWRLYIFKNDQLQDEPYRIHRMNHYLFGRDVSVADIITAHPSCSKQHAVLQFRMTEKNDEYGRPVSAVRPYLLDLGSVNGTFLNGERLEPLRYYELLEKDVVRLGQSTREYVLLHDKSGDE